MTRSGEELAPLEEVVAKTRELHRRVQSINKKMEDLHAGSDEVKRFVAYAQALEEYQRLMNAYLQEVGFRNAVGEGQPDE